LTKLKVLPARPWGALLIYAIYVWKTRYTPAKVLLPELAESVSLTSVDTEKTTFPTKFFSRLEVSRWVPG